jgi:hypothetical protein
MRLHDHFNQCGQFNDPLIDTIFKVQFNIDQQKAVSGILMQLK